MMRCRLLLLALCTAVAGCAPEPDEARLLFAKGAVQSKQFAAIGLAGSEKDGIVSLRDPGRCGDKGEYRLRAEGGAPVLVMAPHAFHDRHTGDLAWLLFDSVPTRAAARNTVPRQEVQGKNEARCAVVDLAGEREHPFTSFALGFSDRFPGGLVVQIHGFDGELRATARARDGAIIVSDGTTEPGTTIFDLADCLSQAVEPREVLIFPVQTRELGGLENAQGQALRDAGGAGFVHLELSLELRRALLEDRRLLDRLGSCLERVAA
ncbi:hypothetical protein P8Q88_07815 [Qipengyuania sp. XHP0207]|uniref:hypothetical protein n=1 Tax=Qipengyuania sp. XHP0207 TaxID=3038078 RepID=UPI00241E6DE5|nr:hypothetical protein [Qipengyuania sp. XHP0207]MDG5748085.1 hypothetical protein [Qipengyuania sp. XHP0207]